MSELIPPVIEDGFFEDPDAVRAFALQSARFWPSDIHVLSGKWPGERTLLLQWLGSNLIRDFLDGLLPAVGVEPETAVHVSVQYSYCVADTPSSNIHRDLVDGKAHYTHVGLVYLTPDPAPNSGTILYEPKDPAALDNWTPALTRPDAHNIKMRLDNQYNRLVVYDPREYHNADTYFGSSLEDARLFLVFFMNVGEVPAEQLLPRPRDTEALLSKHRVVLPNYDKPGRRDICSCGSGEKFKACCGSLSLDRPPPAGMLVRQGAVDEASCQALAEAVSNDAGLIAIAEPEMHGMLKTGGDFAQQAQLQTLINDLAQSLLSELSLAVDWIERPRVHCLPAGAYHFMHADGECQNAQTGQIERVYDRDYTLAVCLDDSYEGADWFFEYFNYRLRPRRGDVMLFPCDQRFRYHIEPVASGQARFAMAWVQIQAGSRYRGALPAGAYRL